MTMLNQNLPEKRLIVLWGEKGFVNEKGEMEKSAIKVSDFNVWKRE